MLCLAVTALLAGTSLAGSPVLATETFSGPSQPAGWSYQQYAYGFWSAPPYTGTGWQDTGYITAETDYNAVRSPEFSVTPLDYYKVTFDSRSSKGKPQVVFESVNTSAQWGWWDGTNWDEIYPGVLYPEATMIQPSSGWTTTTTYMRAKDNAVNAFVRFQAYNTPNNVNLDIDNVSVQTATTAEVAAWADSVYAQMPQLDYTPPADRFQHLTRTMAKLQSQQTTRICMLGDSIMDDTGDSTYDVLIGRRYGTTVQPINAVGSGTGMDKWMHPENFPGLKINFTGSVVDQKPDLVIIGGISSGADYTNIRAAVDKVRNDIKAKWDYDVDIMLVTQVFGTGTEPAGYAATIQSIANEKDCEFLDMHSIWASYMTMANAQGKSWDWFYRDSTHANTYGKQLLGRMLDDYFVPEPATLSLLVLGGLVMLRRRK